MAGLWTTERCGSYKELCKNSFQNIDWPHTNYALSPDNMAEWGLHKWLPEQHYELADGDDCVKCHCCLLITYNWKSEDDRPESGHYNECEYKAWHCERPLMFAPEGEMDMEVSESTDSPPHHSIPGAENLPSLHENELWLRAHIYDATVNEFPHIQLQCVVTLCGQVRDCIFVPCGHITHCMSCGKDQEICRSSDNRSTCDKDISQRVFYTIG